MKMTTESVANQYHGLISILNAVNSASNIALMPLFLEGAHSPAKLKHAKTVIKMVLSA